MRNMQAEFIIAINKSSLRSNTCLLAGVPYTNMDWINPGMHKKLDPW